ncbi:Uma2 family endonuclease [Gloeobacter morelensis]|uniref:Uma2 family endonuclease n=1 Tax=Gloeobacter morelensis MG652769 TaxID=2781736 RepID=A0ABY3PIS3_9CYAN|nr:Uma2 family endonuclease [Gloeobacter morelensis]UFP93453.1 Uma2 family endonuclease [Gloeobacter morelensis MG652769]
MQSLAQDFSACSLLRNVSWETFERLLAELPETRGVRLKYWRGDLEIVTPSDEHETQTEMLGRCAYVLIEALQLPVRSVGSTTFRRADLAAGVEPDTSYYIYNAPLVRRRPINLGVDPPPDLVIEIDVTSSSLDKLAIYAALGVPEVWLYRASRLQIHRLQQESYQLTARSGLFPFVTSADLQAVLGVAEEEVAIANFRTWVKRQLEGQQPT